MTRAVKIILLGDEREAQRWVGWAKNRAQVLINRMLGRPAGKPVRNIRQNQRASQRYRPAPGITVIVNTHNAITEIIVRAERAGYVLSNITTPPHFGTTSYANLHINTGSQLQTGSLSMRWIGPFFSVKKRGDSIVITSGRKEFKDVGTGIDRWNDPEFLGYFNAWFEAMQEVNAFAHPSVSSFVNVLIPRRDAPTDSDYHLLHTYTVEADGYSVPAHDYRVVKRLVVEGDEDGEEQIDYALAYRAQTPADSIGSNPPAGHYVFLTTTLSAIMAKAEEVRAGDIEGETVDRVIPGQLVEFPETARPAEYDTGVVVTSTITAPCGDNPQVVDTQHHDQLTISNETENWRQGWGFEVGIHYRERKESWQGVYYGTFIFSSPNLPLLRTLEDIRHNLVRRFGFDEAGVFTVQHTEHVARTQYQAGTVCLVQRWHFGFVGQVMSRHQQVDFIDHQYPVGVFTGSGVQALGAVNRLPGSYDVQTYSPGPQECIQSIMVCTTQSSETGSNTPQEEPVLTIDNPAEGKRELRRVDNDLRILMDEDRSSVEVYAGGSLLGALDAVQVLPSYHPASWQSPYAEPNTNSINREIALAEFRNNDCQVTMPPQPDSSDCLGQTGFTRTAISESGHRFAPEQHRADIFPDLRVVLSEERWLSGLYSIVYIPDHDTSFTVVFDEGFPAKAQASFTDDEIELVEGEDYIIHGPDELESPPQSFISLLRPGNGYILHSYGRASIEFEESENGGI